MRARRWAPGRAPRSLAPFPLALATLALLAGADPSAAQVRRLRWEDPTLAAAVADADLIVLARALRVARNGVAYQVERTLKGPSKEGKLLAITGLHHPDLSERPPVSSGDLDYLVLRGDPAGEGFVIPTPTLGRFPCRVYEGRASVVASLGGDETFARIAVPQDQFEALLRGLISGQAPGLVTEIGQLLSAERLPGPERTYWSLRMLGIFAGGAQRGMVPLVRRVLEKAGPRASTQRIRSAAASALGKLGGKEAVQLLLEQLKDPQRAVQSDAALALGEAVAGQPGSKAFEVVVERLLAFAREASPRPTTYAEVEDPRTNRTVSPLEAALLALARLRAEEGTALAARALKADNLDTIDAGLSYFRALRDVRQVPTLIGGMRPLADPDRFVNHRFAAALSALTGEDYGIDPAAWRGWWEARQAKRRGPSPTPTPTPRPSPGK